MRLTTSLTATAPATCAPDDSHPRRHRANRNGVEGGEGGVWGVREGMAVRKDSLPTETTKTRHAIMRLLQRADWAMQEGDAADGINSVMRAVRMAAKMDAYLVRPIGLADALGRAVKIVLDSNLSGETLGEVLENAAALLIAGSEKFKGCDYGM